MERPLPLFKDRIASLWVFPQVMLCCCTLHQGQANAAESSCLTL